MATTTRGGSMHADTPVTVGTTGGLAKVMAFRSLYRPGHRGQLEPGSVGVAVDEWTFDQQVQRGRESIIDTGETLDEDVFKGRAARFSYVEGACGDTGTYRVNTAIKKQADAFVARHGRRQEPWIVADPGEIAT
jgi:glucose-6-phosphate 1-dehydrogenase